jgi:uncharacterized protein YggE
MVRYFIPVCLISAALACAQTNANSITVTASRANNVQPDQVVFQVTVNTPLTSSLDDVVSALQGSGIVASNFSSVYTTQTYDGKQYQTVLQWTFSLTAPLANMKATVDLFTGLQMTLSRAGKGMSLSFLVQGMQASPRAQQAQPCSLPDLISDARAQALKIANAAGATVGSILALTNSVSDSTATCSVMVRFAMGGAI